MNVTAPDLFEIAMRSGVTRDVACNVITARIKRPSADTVDCASAASASSQTVVRESDAYHVLHAWAQIRWRKQRVAA